MGRYNPNSYSLDGERLSLLFNGNKMTSLVKSLEELGGKYVEH